MLMSFELSMPANRAWNGKWSGDDKCHAIVKTVDKKNHPKPGYYTYAFGDGWMAAVTVREITAPAARKLRKQSVGFAGYDWMVDSILWHGEILSEHGRKMRREQEAARLP